MHPVRHRRDVGLHGGVAVNLRDFRIVAAKRRRLSGDWPVRNYRLVRIFDFRLGSFFGHRSSF
jgi:hypothetical protein